MKRDAGLQSGILKKACRESNVVLHFLYFKVYVLITLIGTFYDLHSKIPATVVSSVLNKLLGFWEKYNVCIGYFLSFPRCNIMVMRKIFFLLKSNDFVGSSQLNGLLSNVC